MGIFPSSKKQKEYFPFRFYVVAGNQNDSSPAGHHERNIQKYEASTRLSETRPSYGQTSHGQNGHICSLPRIFGAKQHHGYFPRGVHAAERGEPALCRVRMSDKRKRFHGIANGCSHL